MNILSNLNTNVILIGVGALMLFGALATINSRSVSASDQNFGLLLLIAGVICVGIGTGLIDITKLKELLPSNN